jgi:hypothetical protein
VRDNNIDFRFYTEGFTIKKAKDEEGKKVMRIGGIASTNDLDAQGEVLLVEGMDISRLEGATCNWQHQSLKNPASIIGIITKAEKRIGKGLYLECTLFDDSQMAKDVYDLTRRLNKASTKQTMAFSIEGRATHRDEINPKIVTKSIITSTAITPTPINRNTFAEIIKGEVSFEDSLQAPEFEKSKNGLIVDIETKKGNRYTVDEDHNIVIEKAMSSSNSTTIESESLDNEEVNLEYNDKKTKKKKKPKKSFFINEESDNFKGKLNKSQVYDYFLNSIPNLSIGSAKTLYQTVEVLQKSEGNTMSEITKEKLEKAFAILNQVADSSEDLAKGYNPKEFMKSCYDKGMEKSDIFKAMKEKGDDMSDEDMEKEYESEFASKKKEGKEDKKEDKVEKSETKEMTLEDKISKAQSDLEALQAQKDELTKSEVVETPKEDNTELTKSLINSLESKFDTKFNALGEILKSFQSENESIKTLLSTKETELAKSEAEREELANKPNAPKSITTKEYLEKGDVSQGKSNGLVLDPANMDHRNIILEKGDLMINWSGVEEGNLLEKSFANDLENFQYGTGGVTAEMREKFNKNGYIIA